MAWPFSQKSPQKFLGIDVGSSGIQIVELSRQRDKTSLDNYGEIIIRAQGDAFAALEKNTLTLSNNEIAQAISEILRESQIVTRDAFFALPDFSTFFTVLELPQMQKHELPQAIQYEARQHIPLPLSDVTLDWTVINGSSRRTKTKVLLVAVPHDVVNQYQFIAKQCSIKPISLEAEVFGLTRSLVKDKEGVIGVIDAGAQSTTFNVVEDGVLRVTHSFDFSGNELTRTIAKSLNISFNEAEDLKKKYGILNPEIPVGRVLAPFITFLCGEVDKILKTFRKGGGNDIKKVILSGGSSLMPGLPEALANNFKKPVEFGNPFMGMLYPEILENNIKTMSPFFSVSIGTALRGFENN